jgi:hypothetical protein
MLTISREVRDILNDPELIALRDKRMAELTAFYANPNQPHTKETVPVICGNCNFWPGMYGPGETYREPGNADEWLSFALTKVAENAQLIRDEKGFRPVCLEYYAYGVHYIDKMLGADVFFQDGQIYNRYLKTPVGELKDPDLDNDPLWQHSRRVAETFMEADLKFPFFGLPTIASALNIAVNLYSEEFLIAMLADPDAAKHDLDVITRLLVRIHTYYRDTIPAQQLQPVISAHRTQPAGCGQVCGCTTQLISGDLYEEFIAPCDEAVLNVYPNPGMIHLCGSHAQHLPIFRNMKSLHAVQVNDRAAEDLQLYFDGLREDQVIYLNPCAGMTIDKAMEITGGRRLVLCTNARPQ